MVMILVSVGWRPVRGYEAFNIEWRWLILTDFFRFLQTGKISKPVKQLSPLVQEFRNIKSDAEAKVMRKSGEISSKAFIEVSFTLKVSGGTLTNQYPLFNFIPLGNEVYKAWYH
jgi:Xaa-Pro aminopeptidase